MNTLSINISNIYDYSINKKVVEDCFYIIGENNSGNSKTILGIKDNKIIINSNEWLYLLNKMYYNTVPWLWVYEKYQDIVNKYKDVIQRTHTVNINESVVSLITTFCIGTAHGYSGLFCLLRDYLKNHIGKKIIIYKNSQKGILDIIYHIFKIIYYKEDFRKYIIVLDHNIVYKIKEIIFINNEHHTYFYVETVSNDDPVIYKKSADFRQDVTNILSTYIYPTLNTNQYYTNLIKSTSINPYICIFKSTNTQNLTNSNIIPFHDILNFCNKYDAIFINPSDYNEIDVIGILFYCKKFSTMFNNCFHKNFIYIGNNCTEINVYVFPDCMGEYTSAKSSLITTFKNATINYIIQDNLE